MAQQTAMMQLIEWISSDCSPMDCVLKAKELLKIEKEQIIKAHDDGDVWSGEKYYNITYGTRLQNETN